MGFVIVLLIRLLLTLSYILIPVMLLAMAWFWITVIANLFLDIESAISMLSSYLPIGLILGIGSLIDGVREMTKITGRRGHKKIRLKAAVKRNTTNASLDLLKHALLWSCFGLYFLAFWFPITIGERIRKEREDQNNEILIQINKRFLWYYKLYPKIVFRGTTSTIS